MTEPPDIDPATQAIFLDFDGTLVGFAKDPMAVRIDPAAIRRLIDLQEDCAGALAIVSGRRIADLDAFLSPLAFPAAGVHGLERRWAPGRPIERLIAPEAMGAIRERLSLLIASAPELRLEDKGLALVLHYRGASEMAAKARRLMREAVGDDLAMSVMEGNDVVEVHPAGMDKGLAVGDFLKAQPFAGRRPVYIGDDVTDEFALRHVRDAGGIAIKVGAGETAAEFHLADVAAVHAWLGVAA